MDNTENEQHIKIVPIFVVEFFNLKTDAPDGIELGKAEK